MNSEQTYDLVVSGGEVMDPESSLVAVRNIGIKDGTIQAVSANTLRADETIDARGLVVAPGFIDLHAHGQDTENYELQAQDGVTTALELEGGVGDIDEWYGERDGAAMINFGATVGHIAARMAVMGDPGDPVPVADGAYREATEAQTQEMKALLDRGLRRGAMGVGFGIQYTPGASRWEILEMFRVAAEYEAPCHVHMRGMGHKEPMNSIEGLSELIAASTVSGAPLHLVHIGSSGMRAVPRLLGMIEEARTNGVDVTTEVYPYAAAMTGIESAIFAEGWQDKLGIDFGDLEWCETQERLTSESFGRYRETGGWVVMHMIPPEVVDIAVAHELTMIASDGLMVNGKGHPRAAGTYSRVLGRFVRESGTVTLMDALRKMALMPAQRLEHRVPAMAKKGRIKVGADADIVVFDPRTVMDRATYQEPTLPSQGINHVLVNGVPVVRNSELQTGALPGRGILAPIG